MIDRGTLIDLRGHQHQRAACALRCATAGERAALQNDPSAGLGSIVYDLVEP